MQSKNQSFVLIFPSTVKRRLLGAQTRNLYNGTQCKAMAVSRWHVLYYNLSETRMTSLVPESRVEDVFATRQLHYLGFCRPNLYKKYRTRFLFFVTV